MIGLAVTGGIFIAFALASSFLAPRRWPDFPGKNGLSVFIIACVVLFAAMITAVEVFGVESESEAKRRRAERQDDRGHRERLPHRVAVAPDHRRRARTPSSSRTTARRRTTSWVGDKSTKLIQPGESAELTVPLEPGNVSLFCSVDGHRKLGMNAKISVG